MLSHATANNSRREDGSGSGSSSGSGSTGNCNDAAHASNRAGANAGGRGGAMGRKFRFDVHYLETVFSNVHCTMYNENLSNRRFRTENEGAAALQSSTQVCRFKLPLKTLSGR